MINNALTSDACDLSKCATIHPNQQKTNKKELENLHIRMAQCQTGLEMGKKKKKKNCLIHPLLLTKDMHVCILISNSSSLFERCILQKK